jgi:hypothetical protein
MMLLNILFEQKNSLSFKSNFQPFLGGISVKEVIDFMERQIYI